MLTARNVEAYKPRAKAKEYPDGLWSGLYLLVQPSGHKSFVVRYRHHGRSRKYTIGSYPAIDLKAARELASKALRAVAEGRDPQHEKKLLRSARADTFGAVAELFLERHGRAHRKRTRETYTSMLSKHVLPRWGARPAAEITRRDVVALLDEIVDGGSPISANRTYAVIRKIFSWAVTRDIVATSPCVGVRAPTREISRDRVLPDTELRNVWLAADKLGGPYGALVKLLILTGQRRNEIAQARLSEFDLESRLWTVPSERSKNHKAHVVPLSAPAVALLKALPRVGDNEFVLTTNGRVPAAGFGKHKARLDALLPADMSRWVVHDIRRSVATGLARIGVDVPTIEKVLNHVGGTFAGVVGVYQRHDYVEEMRRALNRWGEHVERLVGGEPPKVVALRGPRR